MPIYKICIILLFLAPLTAAGQEAMDTSQQEEIWSKLLQNGIKRGNLEDLQVGGKKITAIYTEQQSDQVQGAIILLHDMGAHPDWADVIRPLRLALPDYGWSILSLQMPVLVKDTPLKEYASLYDDATQRIKAGVEYLTAKNIFNIVLIGHGLGANMGAHMLANNPDTRIRAFIGISMPTSNEDPALEIGQSLEKIRVPILDIYGSRDDPNVLQYAGERARAGKRGAMNAVQEKDTDRFKQSPVAARPNISRAGYLSYRKVEIEGANHFFTQQEDILIKRIRGWLIRHAAGKINGN